MNLAKMEKREEYDKFMQNVQMVSKANIDILVSFIKEVLTVGELIDDTTYSTSTIFSGYKIKELLNNTSDEVKSLLSDLVSNLENLKIVKVSEVPTLENTNNNSINVYQSFDSIYSPDIWLNLGGVSLIQLNPTDNANDEEISLNEYFSKEESDNKFATKEVLDLMNNNIGSGELNTNTKTLIGAIKELYTSTQSENNNNFDISTCINDESVETDVPTALATKNYIENRNCNMVVDGEDGKLYRIVLNDDGTLSTILIPITNSITFKIPSANTTIVLQNDTGGDDSNWNGITDWGDGTSDTNLSHTYATAGTYTVDTKYRTVACDGTMDSNTVSYITSINQVNHKMKSWAYLFYNTLIPTLDISNLDSSNVTDMSYMFANSTVKNLDMSGLDTSNVTNMAHMFDSCRYLTTITGINDLNTDNVEDSNNMFYNCNSYLKNLDISSWKMPKNKNISFMFANCKVLETLDMSGFTGESVETMEKMFYPTSKLSSVNLHNFIGDNVINANMLFYKSSVSSIDMDSFIGSNLQSANYMFRECPNLADLKLSNFRNNKLTSTQYMFYNCTSLKEVSLRDWGNENLKICTQMFNGCTVLEKVDISGWNMKNITTMTKMFAGCSSLTEVTMDDITPAESCTAANYMFEGTQVHDIDNLQLPICTNYAYMFNNVKPQTCDIYCRGLIIPSSAKTTYMFSYSSAISKTVHVNSNFGRTAAEVSAKTLVVD